MHSMFIPYSTLASNPLPCRDCCLWPPRRGNRTLLLLPKAQCRNWRWNPMHATRSSPAACYHPSHTNKWIQRCMPQPEGHSDLATTASATVTHSTRVCPLQSAQNAIRKCKELLTCEVDWPNNENPRTSYNVNSNLFQVAKCRLLPRGK